MTFAQFISGRGSWRENKLTVAALGISLGLHGGLLTVVGLPHFSGDTRETVIEVSLLQDAVSENITVNRASDPHPPRPVMPQSVAPPALPSTPGVNPFTDPAPTRAFLPQAPALPPTRAPRTAPPRDTSSPDILLAYRDVLRSWMDRYKQYPRQAERRSIEGEPLLRLTLDRNGNVLAATLERSSGSALLDREALSMVERAQPFPAFPDYVVEESLEYLIPIVFVLD